MWQCTWNSIGHLAASCSHVLLRHRVWAAYKRFLVRYCCWMHCRVMFHAFPTSPRPAVSVHCFGHLGQSVAAICIRIIHLQEDKSSVFSCIFLLSWTGLMRRVPHMKLTDVAARSKTQMVSRANAGHDYSSRCFRFRRSSTLRRQRGAFADITPGGLIEKHHGWRKNSLHIRHVM